jgi:TolA-binding protein
MKKQATWRGWLGMVAGTVWLLAGGAYAQEESADGEEGEKDTKESEMEREIRYATGLMELRFPDFAASVMQEVERKWPEAKAAAARLRVDSFACQNKFEDAEKEIARIPSNTVEYMSARLLVSDRYYQFGKLPKAREGYDTVLNAYAKNGPPPEMRKFYQESAFKYSQMLLARGDVAGAIRAMRYVLLAKPDENVKRTVQTDLAELLVKRAEALPDGAERKGVLTEAKTLCSDVLWGQADMLYGRALVVLVHCVKLVDGVEKARKAVAEKLPMLEQFEQSIRDAVVEENPKMPAAEQEKLVKTYLRESPMAQCKYLMGTLNEEAGRAALAADKESEAKEQMAAALGHFFTVVMKYPASAWGPEACQHVEAIQAIGRERNWGIEVPENVKLDEVLAMRFKDGFARFADNNYPEAIKCFLQALNVAPDAPEALRSLGMLAQCYFNENKERLARVTVSYLAERYSRAEPKKMNAAGQALLEVAQAFDGPRQRELFLLFTERFTAHDKAPRVLTILGDAALRVTNYVEAAVQYQKVVDKYNKPGTYYQDALSRLAMCQAGLGDHSNVIATLTTYISQIPENAEKISALVRVGDAYRKLEEWEKAGATYENVQTLLDKPNNPYSPAEDRDRNKKTREALLFYRGYCYSRLKPEAPEQAAEMQTKAIDCYNLFLKEYPKSDLAPSVLSNIGTLLFLQNRTEEANKVFETLDKQYPGKVSGILFVQFMSLMDLGRFEKAGELAGRMAGEGTGKYTPVQFLTVGNRLLQDAKPPQPAVAQKAFELARAKADPDKDRGLWEQSSIGLGRALAGASQAVAAAVPVSELLKKYPRGPYTAEANLVLSQAYLAQAEVAPIGPGRTNLFKQATGALATYRQFLKEAGPIASADMQLSVIQMASGEKRKALATYQRVFDMRPGDALTIACIDDAFMRMMPMLMEAKRFDVALENIDYYVKTFPKGKCVVDARMWRSQLPGDLVSKADAAAAAAAAEPTPPAAAPSPAAERADEGSKPAPVAAP